MTSQTSDISSAHGTPRLQVTVTVLAVSSLTIMANATIAPSLPGLAAAFASVPNVETLAGLVLSLPSLAIILTAAVFGALADRIARKRLLLVAMAFYALGGASGLLATTMTELLVGRVLLGVGVAGTMTIATLLAAEFWTGQARVQFMGTQAAAVSVGGIVFLVLGGLLAEISWRGPFLIYLLAVPVAALAWATLPARAVTQRGASGVAKAPLDWGVMARVGSLAFFTMMMFYIIPTRLPFLLTEIGVTSAASAGIAIAAVTATSILSALAFPRLRARLSPVAIFGVSYLLIALAYVTIATASGLPQVVLGTLITGLGLGATMPNQSAWLMAEIAESARGRAAGIMTTLVFAGQFAAPLVAGLLASTFSVAAVFAIFSGALTLIGVALLIGTALQKPALKQL